MKNMMKKISAVSACTVILFAAACTKQEDKEEMKEKTIQETAQTTGAWSAAEDGTITPELQEIFDKAMEGLTGVGYTPLELLETQLVSGTNYKFLCDAVTVVPDAPVRKTIVTIYRDREGNCEILDIEDVNSEEESTPLLGGWTKPENAAITDELQAIFDQAMEGWTGVSYTPVELTATQLVSGTNYKFLCDAETVTPGAEKRQVIITVYRNLQGVCEVLDIEDVK